MPPADICSSTTTNNNNITGLSHISLSAPNELALKNSCAFYAALGFKPLATHQDAEALLLLHTEPNPLLQTTDLSLKLNLTPHPAQVPSTNIESALAAPVAICFACHDIAAMETEIKRLGRPCNKVMLPPVSAAVGNQDARPVELYVLDPAAHTIVFTNRQSAFSTATHLGTSRKAADKPAQPNFLNINSNVDDGARKKKIGILTSGGDAPGMNAAVRSIVRVSIARGCDPYAIYEGYEGLVNGGDMIKKMTWESVRGWLSLGGTNIGTARCASFRTREGRLKAAHNLILNGIDALVVIGGDGSLTGADKMRAEWSSLLKDLVDQKKLTAQEIEPYQFLTIVGLVGSIDNDMSLTDITIGAVSSLHRVCEAVDNIASTAMSHGRAFVVEVMGRHCGWLALSSAISTGADWVFLPECPPSSDNWEEDMCNRLKKNRTMGKRMTIVIICEGAIDRNVNPIKSDQIKDILIRMGLDTRVTTLGHVQRGGTPCAFDRYLATLQGVEAVNAVLRAKPDTPSPMIGMSENKITCVPLVKAVETTHAVAKAIEEKDFVRAMDLRDPEFASTFEANQAVNMLENLAEDIPAEKRLRIGILHVGAPAGGMNAAARTAARLCISRGHCPLAIRNGFPGLCAGDVTPLKWLDLEGWVTKGGCELGTNRTQPDVDIGQCAYQLQRHNIHGLIIIGGFEAFTALSCLEKHRSSYPSFCIPMIVIPATISNNVPGTDYSIGSDTALNAIVDSCDRIKQSATASRRRVFVVETQGGKCGYLATLSGLAAGATCVYIPEEGISLKRLQQDVQHLVRRYSSEPAGTSEGRLVLRCETTSSTYTTEVVSAILKEEGRGVFDSRTAILGHTQQGGTPSPLDRIRATRLAVRSVHWIEQQAYAALERSKEPGVEVDGLYGRHDLFRDDPETAVVIGIRGAHMAFTPVRMLKGETDVKNRKALNQWWLELGNLIRLLAKYEC